MEKRLGFETESTPQDSLSLCSLYDWHIRPTRFLFYLPVQRLTEFTTEMPRHRAVPLCASIEIRSRPAFQLQIGSPVCVTVKSASMVGNDRFSLIRYFFLLGAAVMYDAITARLSRKRRGSGAKGKKKPPPPSYSLRPFCCFLWFVGPWTEASFEQGKKLVERSGGQDAWVSAERR